MHTTRAAILRRALILPIVGLAVMVPSLATAASGHRAKATGKPVSLTQHLFQYASSGAPPVSGSNAYVGTSDGRIAGAAVKGTTRGTNTYPGGGSFTGKNTLFYTTGSINISFKASAAGPGQFAGSGKFTGGTGKYKGARGKFTFTATQQGPGTFLRVLTGRISFS